MTGIEKVVNIGPSLARDLRAAGIASLESLRARGSQAAWERIRAINPQRDCASSRLALEGAVRGVRWMSIDPAERRSIWARARG